MPLLCTFTRTPNLVVTEAPSLARSQKLQEHVWERSGALAPAMSLRLEVTRFAACLRDKRSDKESLSGLCLLSTWTEALLVATRFLRTQIGSCRIWPNWKCNGLLPLVALARSGQRRLPGGFCLNSLAIPFVESVEMNWKDWP